MQATTAETLPPLWIASFILKQFSYHSDTGRLDELCLNICIFISTVHSVSGIIDVLDVTPHPQLMNSLDNRKLAVLRGLISLLASPQALSSSLHTVQSGK